ncbi:hypothetical protein QFZ34_002209 [Phyllobacterium ifriqiyense]|uniref:Uncharacterized protein n=1 Tax=Phyllobacterium ifriqiyense TaxID=314238 RepID=A0ABU0S8E6_9HYPH|nr:hypothetical protein [Phyllobacterium ifriqiyense]MDQ0997027.1 hypothetical protein [Phyllobacterium ifriqiyense]
MDAFPEREHEKYMVRLITREMIVELPGKGSVKILPHNSSNLYSIEFKGLKSPEHLKGKYTTLHEASTELRKYLDDNKIEFGEIERYASMDDRRYF